MVCSPGLEFSLVGTDFGCAVLHLVDQETTYFTRSADETAAAVCHLAVSNEKRSIVFVGGSKGGYAAALLASLAANVSDHAVGAVCFSAQTSLFPLNDRLYFPSYKSFFRRASQHPEMMRDLARFGDLASIKASHAKFLFVYGLNDAVDRGEAERVVGANITKYAVPISFHGSMVPFFLNRFDRADVERKVRGIYAGAQPHPEAIAALPRDPDDLVECLMRLDLPSLDELIARQFGEIEKTPGRILAPLCRAIRTMLIDLPRTSALGLVLNLTLV